MNIVRGRTHAASMEGKQPDVVEGALDEPVEGGGPREWETASVVGKRKRKDGTKTSVNENRAGCMSMASACDTILSAIGKTKPLVDEGGDDEEVLDMDNILRRVSNYRSLLYDMFTDEVCFVGL